MEAKLHDISLEAMCFDFPTHFTGKLGRMSYRQAPYLKVVQNLNAAIDMERNAVLIYPAF